MKIVIVGKFDKESFGSHISDELLKMGHETIQINKGIHYWHFKSALLNRINSVKVLFGNITDSIPLFRNLDFRKIVKLLDREESKNVDLIIVTHDFLTPYEVQVLKDKTRAPILLWFPDAIVNFGKAMFLGSNYDFLFFKDPYVVEVLKREIRKKIYYLPECCNPYVHKISPLNNADKSKFSCDITTAGNFYTNRACIFEQLSEYNYSIKIWGNPPSLWMNTEKVNKYLMGEYVMHENKSKAFQLGKIVLNNLHPAEISGINCRAFEIPALGGFQIISWRPAISELFELGKEIETYKSFDELLEKINYYLSNEILRNTITNAGNQRVIKDHTYNNRLDEMLKLIDK